MGYLLKEALKTLCGVSQWSYAIFWKIGWQNPKLLIWEESYYEAASFSVIPRFSGIESPEVAFEDWEACLVSSGAQTSLLGVQAEDKVHSLVNKMMTSNQVNIVGEGLVGRAAFTGKHQWIHLETYAKEVHPPEVLNELCQQFSAGMQTIAVIPVLPHGVVQLGSSLTIVENMGVVDGVRSLILQLGCVPGALLPDNYTAKEPVSKIGGSISLGNSISSDQSENYKVLNTAPFGANYCGQQNISSQASGLVGQPSRSLDRQIQDSLRSTAAAFEMPSLAQNLVKYHNELCRTKVMPLMKPDLSFRDQLENRVAGAEVLPSGPEVWLKQQASLYMPQSGINQQPYVGTSPANYSSVRSMEEEILSGAFVQDNGNNSSSVSSGFMASVLGTNGCLIASPHKDSVNNPLLEASQLPNGVTDHLRSISDPCSLPSSQRAAGSNIFCTRRGSSGLQNAGSFKTEVSTSDLADQSANGFFSGSSDFIHHLTHNKSTQIEMSQKKEKIEHDIFDAVGIPATHLDEKVGSSERSHSSLHGGHKQDDGNCSLRSRNAKDKDGCAEPPSGDDLFDILGVDFKNKLLDGSWNSFLSDGPGSNTKSWGKNNSTFVNLREAGCDLLSVNGGNSNSGIFSISGSDHLLDAVVSKVHCAPKQSSEHSVSCSTTLTNSSAPNASSFYGPANVSDQMQGELSDLPKALLKTGAIGSCSFKSGCSKEEAGNCSQTSSLYGSQISSWVEQGHNMKRNSSISTAYSKRPDEISKCNRKRLKPGENPRPRPKDRQMIQDRVKELREIVPNGAKCSIDALLERTIKHMLFLQSVMKHADKLKQTGESKIISKEGGLLLKDNFEGGATWAYEVGSQSMVCPIIVEDLNPPRQMLVEMLCEERGLFLEIADIIRGLGLTILKGVMETRNDKIWARFAVEANRDVTRMEIFLSLVRLLEQTVKSSVAPVNGVDNDNVMVHQPFLEGASIPAVGRPCSLQ